MINIHNFYEDIIESFYNYLKNDVIFSLQGFESNLINPGLKSIVDRKPNQKLPFVLFNINNLNQDEARQAVHGFAFGESFGQRQVLHNHTKDLTVLLQEDWIRISTEVNINCDSQIQALDIKHHLMTRFPINNPLNHYVFTSFFKVPEYLLVKNFINPEKDFVHNLYCKEHECEGVYDYFYAVGYNPLIEVNSMDIQMNDVNDTSFQISMGVDFLTNIPIRVIYPWINTQKTNKLCKKTEALLENVLITTDKSPINYVLYLRHKKTNELKKHYINIEDKVHEFGELFYDRIERIYIYKTILLTDDGGYDVHVYLYFTNNNIFKYGDIESRNVVGKIYNPIVTDKKIDCFFEGRIENTQINEKIELIIDKFSFRDVVNNMSINSKYWTFIDGHDYTANESIKNLPDINQITTVKKIKLKEIDSEQIAHETSSTGKFNLHPYVIFDENLEKLKHFHTYGSVLVDLYVEYDESYNVGTINNVNIDFNAGINTIAHSEISYTEDISDSYNIVITEPIIEENDDFVLFYITTIFRIENLSDLKWIINIPDTKFHIGSYILNDNSVLFEDTLSSHNQLVFKIDENIYSQYFKINKLSPLFFYIKRNINYEEN